MKYYIKTFGCQMNHSDSERIAGFLEMQGLEKSDDIKEATLVVFNTCGVRQMAEDRVYGQIHNLHETWGIEHKTKKIILTGCLAHRKDVQRRLKDKVDLFVNINNFQKEIRKIISPLPPTPSPPGRGWGEGAIKYSSPFTAYIPIMTGCNNFCSYCVVPYARGREVSRTASEILKEIKSLIKKGYKEIVLLGQNVNSYKSQTKHKTQEINFSKLLKLIDKIPSNFWISFVSNHPKDFSDELIETATKLKKVCEYIHLPIQSGDDKILEKMNRKYTRKQYLALIGKIKKSFQKYKPDKLYSITSDIIVGFPGETKKQFQESAKIMEKVKYDMVYFGQFSPRPETAAWKMKDNVSKEEKSRREKYLNEILKETSFENNQKYLNKTLEVLIDKEARPPIGGLASKKSSKITYFGRTRTMKNVKLISDDKNLVGKIIKAKIAKASDWNLEGKIK